MATIKQSTIEDASRPDQIDMEFKEISNEVKASASSE